MTDAIASITNYLKLSDRLATAGQPTAAQLRAIAEAGYQTVVNLAPPNQKNALPSEDTIVENLGMQYVSIPVAWENPTIADLERFFAVMQHSSDRPVFVHCAMNMRVSAFVYLYRHLRQGVSEEIAAADLEQIWVPNSTWQAFIDRAIAHDREMS